MFRNVQVRTKRWVTVVAALLIAAAFVIALLFLIGAGYVEWHAFQDNTNDAGIHTDLTHFTTVSSVHMVHPQPTKTLSTAG